MTRTVDVVRTYLAMHDLAELRPGKLPAAPVRLDRLDPCPVERWRALYRQIGSAWHWHDRDAWDAETIQRHLQRDGVQVYQLTAPHPGGEGDPVGFLELEHHADGSVEIVYLGIDRRVFGQGIGGWLVAEAIRRAFALGTHRVWLHTCTLDGPAALPNYLARGFRIERTENYQAILPA